jgi:hypothetical protein
VSQPRCNGAERHALVLTRGAHDQRMDETEFTGPDPDAIAAYITTAYPDTVVARAMNAWFFSLDETHWPNFATIVTTDEHDQASNLERPGVFRLNIGVGKDTFLRLVGERLDDPAVDYAVLDTVLPHPVYAAQRWVSILNPSDQTFEAVVKPLLEEAYQRLERQRRLQGGEVAE